jgi:hypothetical protein
MVILRKMLMARFYAAWRFPRRFANFFTASTQASWRRMR